MKTRGAVVAAILQNGDMIKDVLETSGQEAAGATDAAMDVALDSIDAKVKRLTQSWQSLWQNFIDTDLVKGVIDLLNNLVQVLDKIVNIGGSLSNGGAVPLASMIFGGMSAVNKITGLNGPDSARGFDLSGVFTEVGTNAWGAFQKAFTDKKNFDALNRQVGGGVVKDLVKAFKELSAEEKAALSQGDFGEWAKGVVGGGEAFENAFKMLGQTASDSKTSIFGLFQALSGGTSILPGVISGFKTLGLTIASVAGSVAIAAGATVAITALIKAIDGYIRRYDIAIEKGKEYVKNQEDKLETYRDNIKVIDELTPRFQELAKGVDQYGNNIGLTADEYEEYQALVKQLVSIQPSLIRGYDQERGALIDKTTALQEASDAQKEYIKDIQEDRINTDTGAVAEINAAAAVLNKAKEAYNEASESLTVDGIEFGNDWIGVLGRAAYMATQAQNGQQVNIKAQTNDLQSTMKQLYEASSYFQETKKDFNQFLKDNYVGLEGDASDAQFFENNQNAISELTQTIINDLSAADEYAGSWETLTEKVNDANEAFSEYQTEVKRSNILAQNNLRIIAEQAEGYKNLTDQYRNVISNYIESINTEDLLDDNGRFSADKYSGVKKDIDDLTTYLLFAQDAFAREFNNISDKLSPEEYEKAIDAFVEAVVSHAPEELELDEMQVRAAFKFEFYDADEAGQELTPDRMTSYINSKLSEAGQKLPDNIDMGTIKAMYHIVYEMDKNDQDINLQSIMAATAMSQRHAELEDIEVKSFQDLSSEVNKAGEALALVNALEKDGATISSEYYDIICDLAGGEELLSQYTDAYNDKGELKEKVTFKNINAAKKLVQAHKEESQVLKDLRSNQADLVVQYQDTISAIEDATIATGDFSEEAWNSVDYLFDNLDALDALIDDYAILELQLLGAADAFTEFATASDLDTKNNFGDSMIDMLKALDEGLHTGKIGTNAFRAAFEGLVPDDFEPSSDVIKRTEDYLRELVKRGWLAVSEDKKNFEITADTFTKFIQFGGQGHDGLAPVFKESLGSVDWSEFELNGRVTIEDLAEYFDMTIDGVFAYLMELSKYDVRGNSLLSQLATQAKLDIEEITKLKAKLQELKASGDANPDDVKLLEDQLADAESRVNNTSIVSAEQAILQERRQIIEEMSDCYDKEGKVIEGQSQKVEEYNNKLLENNKQQQVLAEESADKLTKLYDLKTQAQKLISEQADLQAKLEQAQESGHTALVKAYSDKIKENQSTLSGLEVQMKNIGEATEEVIKLGTDYLSEHGQQDLADAITASFSKDVDTVDDAITRLANAENMTVEALTMLCESYDSIIGRLEAVAEKSNDLSDHAGPSSGSTTSTTTISSQDKKALEDYGKAIYNNVEIQKKFNDKAKEAYKQQNNIKSDSDLTAQDWRTIYANARQARVEFEKSAEALKNIQTNSSRVKIPTVKPTTTKKKSSSTSVVNLNGRMNVPAATGLNNEALARGNTLVGELGRELVVDSLNRRYYTVGENGAEFIDLPKDAIVFSHKQTEELLKNGHTGRGTATGRSFVTGNAYVTSPEKGNPLLDWSTNTRSSSSRNKSKNSKDAKEAADEWFSKFEDALRKIEDEFAKTYETIRFDAVDAASQAVGDIEDEITDAYDFLVKDLQRLNELNVDPLKSVFGNIDLNNRQVIEWTERTVDQAREALESWNEDLQSLPGSISTVLGQSTMFDEDAGGVEIAFTPMLQTDHGAELLSRDTVYKYIDTLIDNIKAANNGTWNNAQLFALDAQGLEIDGIKIKNLIADIGETAIATGEAMHYLGTDGQLQLNLRKVQEAADKAGVSLEAYYKIIERYEQNGYKPSTRPQSQFDPQIRQQYYNQMVALYQQYYAQYGAADEQNSEKLKDAWEKLYGEQKKIVEDAYNDGQMTTRQYLQNLPILYKTFYGQIDGFAKQSAEAQREYVRTVKSLYEQMFAGVSTILGNQISDLQDQMNDQVKAYQDTMKELERPIDMAIRQLEAQIYDYQQMITGLEDQIYDIDQQIKGLERSQKPIEKQIKANEKAIKAKQKLIAANNKEIKANEKIIKSYEKQIDANNKAIKANEKIIKAKQKIIDANNDEIKANEKVIKQYEKQIKANDKEIAANDKIIKSKQKIIDANNEEIKANEKVIKQFQKQINANDKLIKANDKIVNNKQKIIDANDEEIKANEKIIKANDRLIRDNQDIIDIYEEQIEAHQDSEEPLKDQIELNDEILDKIEKANEARQRAINLEKAQYDLARAENQKTQRVFTGEGFTYQTDTSAVRDARNNLDDQLVEQRRADIQSRSDAVQEQIDKIEDQIESIEKLVKALEKENDQIDKQSEIVRRTNEEIQDRSDLVQEQIDKINKQSQAIQEQSDIIQESIDIYTERNEAIQERSDLVQEEIDRLTKANESIQERSDLINEEIEKIREWNEAISERSEAIQEEIDLIQKQNEAISERSELIQNDIDKIKEQNEIIQERSDLIQEEIDRITEQNELFNDQLELIKDQIDSLNEQKDAIQIVIDTYNRENELLNRQREQYEHQKQTIEVYYNDLIESTQDFYQAQVDALEKIQKQFQKMQELDELAKTQQLLKDFGVDMNNVINDNEATMQKMKDKYAEIVAATYQDNRDLLKTWGDLLKAPGLENMVVSADDVATSINEMTTKGRNLNVVSDGIDKIGTSTGNASTDVDTLVGKWDYANQVVATASGAMAWSITGIRPAIQSVSGDLDALIWKAQRTADELSNISSYNHSNYPGWYSSGSSSAFGTALVNGSWGLKSGGPALVGELGPEIVVRNGRYFTVGDHGPEIRKDLQRGDIIFNASQSRSIFKYGKAAGRGKAFADGTTGNFASGLIPSQAPDYITKFMNVVKNLDLNISKIVPAFKAPNLSFATGNAPALAGAGGETFTINTVNVTMPNFNSTNSEGFVKDLKNKALQRFSRR